MISRLLLPVALLVVCGTACAVGTTDSAGDGDDGGSGGDDTSDAASHGDGARDGGSGFDAATSGDGGGGVDGAGGDGGGGIDSGGNTISCAAPSPCPGGTALGSISGDTSGSPVTSSGDTSEWLELIVTEDDSGPFATPMKLHIDLTSPAGTNFDLYAYRGASPGAIECSAVTSSSTNGAGQTDSIDMTWGESGTLANGSDDTRTVTIEVRQVTGACMAGANWTLNAHGH